MADNHSEQILARILEAAEQSASATLADAEEKASARLAAERAVIAENEAAEIAAQEQAKSRALHAAESAAALSVRSAALRCRREEIDRTLEATLAHLRALPDAEYFALLSALIRQNGAGEGGELLLSAADLRRVPDGFAAELSLTLCDKPASIDGGCVLRYGDIEENLSFAALIEEHRDALEDTVCRVLWGA